MVSTVNVYEVPFHITIEAAIGNNIIGKVVNKGNMAAGTKDIVLKFGMLYFYVCMLWQHKIKGYLCFSPFRDQLSRDTAQAESRLLKFRF